MCQKRFPVVKDRTVEHQWDRSCSGLEHVICDVVNNFLVRLVNRTLTDGLWRVLGKPLMILKAGKCRER